MELSPYLPRILVAFGVLFGLEIVYVLVRRALRRFRPRLIYHFWALCIAALSGLASTPLARPEVIGWDALCGAAAVLSTLIAFALFEALVLVRPWSPGRGAFIPKLARDVIRILLAFAAIITAGHFLRPGSLSGVAWTSATSIAILGLALQDLLKNIFAGMSLQMEKPFHTGDWLMVEGRGLAQVLDVSWRSTRLRTTEGIEIFEPNTSMAAARLTNYGSGRLPVAFSLYFALPSATPPAVAKAALLAAAHSAPGVLETPSPEAYLDHFGDSAISYRLRVWTLQVASATRFQDSVQSRVWYQLQRRGIDTPFPTRTIQMHDSLRENVETLGRIHHETASLLSNVELFKDLGHEAQGQLAAATRRHVFDDGETLVKEGDTGDSLFVLERGKVQVTKSGSSVGTAYVVLARLKAGDFFGEMSLLTGEPRSATVTAEGCCEVLVLDHAALAPVLAADPSLAESLSRSLAARSAATSAKLENRRERGDNGGEPQTNLLRRIRAFFSLPE